WAQLAGDRSDDPLAPAARLLARAAEGGAPVADTVARLAQDARAVARAAGEQAARRVGVLVVAPLGLCFLPAFVLLGVVPVVLGLAGPLFASL
ncbi:MAG: type II secretion system F family protein, partial [Actinobacteria bacterium]|nr:type II secretion system F family protein [Actinomycetota bacterium]